MTERFIVTLEPLPEGPPTILRLRLALKSLLRRHGLRAVDVRAETSHQTPQDARSDARMTPEPSQGARRTSGAVNAAGAVQPVDMKDQL